MGMGGHTSVEGMRTNIEGDSESHLLNTAAAFGGSDGVKRVKVVAKEADAGSLCSNQLPKHPQRSPLQPHFSNQLPGQGAFVSPNQNQAVMGSFHGQMPFSPGFVFPFQFAPRPNKRLHPQVPDSTSPSAMVAKADSTSLPAMEARTKGGLSSKLEELRVAFSGGNLTAAEYAQLKSALFAAFSSF
jgi:hypothetical protein